MNRVQVYLEIHTHIEVIEMTACCWHILNGSKVGSVGRALTLLMRLKPFPGSLIQLAGVVPSSLSIK